ncbi:hypothetical protein ACJJTC_013452 [Scirpophaga incertulas]
MPDKFKLFTDCSPADFELVLNDMMTVEDLNTDDKLEIDISKYDKSQGELLLEFELEIYRLFGIPEDRLAQWRSDLVNYDHVEQYRVSLCDLMYQFSNSLNNIWINDALNERYRLTGDHSLLARRHPSFRQTFQADAAGFVELIEEEYHALSDVDHHIMWWYKVALCHQSQGVATTAEDKLIHFVNGYSPSAGAGAAAYLSGMGDFTDATGVKHKLTSVMPNEHGHYGRVTAENHSHYEMSPAPALSLQRIMHDFVRTAGRNVPEMWDVPELAPVLPRADAVVQPGAAGRVRREAENRAGDEDDGLLSGAESDDEEQEPPPAAPPTNRPTVNMLGWRPAKELSRRKLQELQMILGGQRYEELDIVNPTFKIHRGLFEFVHRRIVECKRYKIAAVPTGTHGSVAQQLIWEPITCVTHAHTPITSQEGKVTVYLTKATKARGQADLPYERSRKVSHRGQSYVLSHTQKGHGARRWYRG